MQFMSVRALCVLLISFCVLQVLGLMSSQCSLYFLDIESSLFLKNVIVPQTNISKCCMFLILLFEIT
jgi:hypothetical protein